MDRRTFLKCVFAASVAPASVVRGLYSPAITVEWVRFGASISWDKRMLIEGRADGYILDESTKWPTYLKECREDIHHLENLMREAVTVTTWQPPISERAANVFLRATMKSIKRQPNPKEK